MNTKHLSLLISLSYLLMTTATVNAAPPRAPILRAPVTEVSNVSPTFKWTNVTGANSYQLSIKDSNGTMLSFQYQAAQKCSANTKQCTATPKLGLPPGNTSWRVRAKNADTWGVWSAFKQFTVAPAFTRYDDALEAGDHYDYVTDNAVATSLFNDLWRILADQHVACWISEYNSLTQYQFYEDVSFLPGPLYRYNGFDVSVGQLRVYSIGWYYQSGKNSPLKAAYVNAAIGDFLLVLTNTNTFVEAYWHNNYLVATPYHIGQQCL